MLAEGCYAAVPTQSKQRWMAHRWRTQVPSDVREPVVLVAEHTVRPTAGASRPKVRNYAIMRVYMLLCIQVSAGFGPDPPDCEPRDLYV
jgi:hypothetical protein